MSQSKKYDFSLSQEQDTWNAAIVRRASAKKTVITKTQSNFKTEAEAKKWAEDELVLFTAKQSAQNKRRAEKRR